MSMPFRKGNKLGAKKFSKRPLDGNITIHVYEGQKEKLKQVRDWQNKLRDCIDQVTTPHTDALSRYSVGFLF